MPSTTSVPQLRRLGCPDAPVRIDVRKDQDFTGPPALACFWTPRRQQRRHVAPELRGKRAVEISQRGGSPGEGAAAWLRAEGVLAEVLERGFEAWRDGEGLFVRPDGLPPSDTAGRMVWVTRVRACGRRSIASLVAGLLGGLAAEAVFSSWLSAKCGRWRSLMASRRSISMTRSGASAVNSARSCLGVRNTMRKTRALRQTKPSRRRCPK